MEENVYLAEFHAQKGHMEQLAELDNRFHDIMYEACDSKLLEHIDILHILFCDARHIGAFVGNDPDQSLQLQLPESLPDR